MCKDSKKTLAAGGLGIQAAFCRLPDQGARRTTVGGKREPDSRVMVRTSPRTDILIQHFLKKIWVSRIYP